MYNGHNLAVANLATGNQDLYITNNAIYCLHKPGNHCRCGYVIMFDLM